MRHIPLRTSLAYHWACATGKTGTLYTRLYAKIENCPVEEALDGGYMFHHKVRLNRWAEARALPGGDKYTITRFEYKQHATSGVSGNRQLQSIPLNLTDGRSIFSRAETALLMAELEKDDEDEGFAQLADMPFKERFYGKLVKSLSGDGTFKLSPAPR